jgi:leucyl aminopeptidase (aminopeptidase T)
MSEIGAVSKDKKNTMQNYSFRGIDDFLNSLYPALIKHGVFLVPSCLRRTSEIREVVRGTGKTGFDKVVELEMEYTFYAEDGSSVKVGPIPSEAVDSSDKAVNKALSAALKYCLIQTFSIPTQDMEDSDNDSPQIHAPKKNQPIDSDKT